MPISATPDPRDLRAGGWDPLETGGFNATLGQLWRLDAGGEVTVGFFVGEAQCNDHLGTVHGGALMTFADIALGSAVVRALEDANCATLSLQNHFVSAGRVGEFLYCRGEVVRRTRNLVFMRGLIQAGERVVAQADGIWKIIHPKAD